MKKKNGVLLSVKQEDLILLDINQDLFWEDVTEIGNGSFMGLKDLQVLYIPEGITAIGSYAFKDVVSLTHVHFPSSLKIIKAQAFQNCRNITALNIPKGIEEIELRAFCGCNYIKILNVPNNSLSLGEIANAINLQQFNFIYFDRNGRHVSLTRFKYDVLEKTCYRRKFNPSAYKEDFEEDFEEIKEIK